MENLFNIEETRKIFQKEFPEVNFNYKCEKIGSGNLYIFFLSFKDEKNILELWRKVSNAIAIYFQSKIEDDFGKYNTYLFYLFEGIVDRDLKYKIENDPFSSRKIIIDNLKKDLNDSEIIKLLNERILSSDIFIDKKNVSSGSPNFQLSKLTENLLSENLPLGDKEECFKWLNKELERLENNEI